MEWLDRQSDYLVRDDLITLIQEMWGDYALWKPLRFSGRFRLLRRKVTYWRERIVNLLNAHHITLVNESEPIPHPDGSE